MDTATAYAEALADVQMFEAELGKGGLQSAFDEYMAVRDLVGAYLTLAEVGGPVDAKEMACLQNRLGDLAAEVFAEDMSGAASRPRLS